MKKIVFFLFCLCVPFMAKAAASFTQNGIKYDILKLAAPPEGVPANEIVVRVAANDYTGEVVIPDYVTLTSALSDANNTYPAGTYPVSLIAADAFRNRTGLTKVTLPGTLLAIMNGTMTGYAGAFSGCTGLTGIAFPASLVTIGNYAFSGCTGLKEVEFPASLKKISLDSFRGCTSLTKVTIPASVTDVYKAFDECTKIKDVYCLGDTPPSAVKSVFTSTVYSSATLYVPEGRTAAYQSNTESAWYQFETIKEMLGARLLEDKGNSSAAYADAENSTPPSITYTRTFSTTQWQAFYVPFEVSYERLTGSGLEVATINAEQASKGSVKVSVMTEGTLAPNTPYLVRAGETGVKTIALTGATLYAADTTPHVYGDFTITGTYEDYTGMYANKDWAMSGGSLKQAASASAKVPPYRWYLHVKDGAEVKMVFVENDIVDAIDTLTLGHDGQLHEAGPWFNLQGQRVGQPQRGGIYIHNGRKVLF